METGEAPDVRVDEWRAADAGRAGAVAHLFDDALDPHALEAFLVDDRHHLLIASIGGEPAGMVTAVELLHPDKPRPEMFLYELGVDASFRRRGVATALLRGLLDLSRARGCGDVFVLADETNGAADATYRRAGGTPEPGQVMFTWALARPPEDRGNDAQR